MKKWILRIFLALVLIVVVGLIVLYFSLNSLVRAGVVRGGKYATDQDTGLNEANLSLSGGSLKLAGFDIANLTGMGYKEPKLLAMKSCSTSVDTSSLFGHTVTVNEINIDGLEVWLEQNGMKNNLNDLMQILQKKTAATGSAPTADGTKAPAGNTPPGKELKIGVLKLTGTRVHLIVGSPLNINKTFTLPDLEMKDPTNPDGRPMKIADLIGKILLQLSKQIVESPELPGDIKDQMKNVTALVDNLKGQLDKNLKELPNLQNMTMPDTKGLQDAGKNLQDLNPFKKKN